MKGYKTATAVTAVISALLLVALLVRAVVGEIEYQRQADYTFLPDYTYVFFTLAPISLFAIVGGFWSMRKAPMLCALLVTSGSSALAIMTYWLIAPQ